MLASATPASATPPAGPELTDVPAVLDAELSATEKQSLAALTDGSGVQLEAFVVTPGGAEIVTFDADSRADAEAATDMLEAQPSVESAALTVPVAATAGALPQYGNTMLRTTEAIAEVDNPLSDVVVAVLDTGVAPHPELAAALLPGQNFTDSPGGPTDTGDVHGHGTHVAGTVGADLGSQVEGVAPGVRILPVKVLGDGGGGFSNWANSGIIWAADNGADVINMSLGGAGGAGVYASAVAYARARGVTVIAAAGNDNSSAPHYPSGEAGVISVSAVDAASQKAAFSNYGPTVDVAAPGVAITSTDRSGGFSDKSGTSMASPHVAGVAALIKAAAPGLTPDQVEQALVAGVTDLGAAGRDDIFGHGLVNALQSVRAANSLEASLPPSTNRAPVADDETLTVPYKSGSHRVDVLTGDTDPDGDVLGIASFTQGSRGAVTTDNGQLRYTPSGFGPYTDSFTYVVTDYHGGTATGTVRIDALAPPTLDPAAATDLAIVHRLGADSMNLWRLPVSQLDSRYGAPSLVRKLDYGGFSYDRSRTLAGDVGDVTGSDDGTPDQVIWHAQPNGGVLLWAVGGGPDTAPRLWLDLRTGGWSWADSLPMLGDVTGDGFDDLVVRHAFGPTVTNIWVFPSDGQRLGAPQLWGKTQGMARRSLLIDADGDGREDLLVARPQDGTAGLSYDVLGANTSGTAFDGFDRTVFSGPAAAGWSAGASRTLAGDVTGDGKPDLITVHAQGGNSGLLVWVHRNCTDVLRAPCFAQPVVWQDLRTGGWSYAGSRQYVADTDGDGTEDLISAHSQAGNPGILVWRHRSTSTALLTPDIVADLRAGGWSYINSRATVG